MKLHPMSLMSELSMAGVCCTQSLRLVGPAQSTTAANLCGYFAATVAAIPPPVENPLK